MGRHLQCRRLLGTGFVRLIVPSLRAGAGPDAFQGNDFWFCCRVIVPLLCLVNPPLPPSPVDGRLPALEGTIAGQDALTAGLRMTS